ncbi:MAG: Fe-S cluster assembly protein SufD [Actinomycetota bacterium]|nr:Fe-S cluster assembly protein SufD [Actinomycetota bacterium]
MALTDGRPHSGGPGSSGSPAERFTSRDPEAFEVPRGREEQWRFTPLRDLRALLEPFVATGKLVPSVRMPESASWSVVPMDHPAVGRVLEPEDRVSALAFAHSDRAVLVQIPAGAQLAEPVVLTLRGEPGLTYGHLVIDIGAGAHATVIIEHVGLTTVAANVEFVVGDGAHVTAVCIQDWDEAAIQLAAHSALVGRDASFKHVVVNLGGRVVRLAPTVRFAGPGGNVELLGVSFAGTGQHLESRLFIDHSAPECTSNVLYKNALQGESSRTVWIGDVRIRPSATGTNTYEMNRNLLLSDGARADSVPNLEIETGEIAGAGHASATGRFDDLQLFYLQSRGIDVDEAQRLVVRGFFADVVDRIGLPDLQHRIMTAIESRLGFAAAEPELETV